MFHRDVLGRETLGQSLTRPGFLTPPDLQIPPETFWVS